MTKNIISVIFIVLVFGCNPSPNSHSENDKFEIIVNDFESQLQEDLKDDNIEGSISAAIVKGDKIIWSKAFGYSDRDRKISADTTTIYRTGSISKSFTAVLMMMLVEEGIIKLNDPIELYLPEVRNLIGYNNSTAITFLDLSSHTSGLIREPELIDAASGPLDSWENKIIQSISQTSFAARPGEKFSYSNIGYGILGLALSRAAKKPFIELITDKIFVPLKMKNSYFKVPIQDTARLAKGIAGEPGELDMELPKIEHIGRGYKVPNGGIYSTPNDLSKFAIACMGYSKLLRPENLDSMQTTKSSNSNCGLGFFINNDNEGNIVNHGGAVAGYTAQFAFDKASKYGVVIMKNYNFGATDLSASSYVVLKELRKLNAKKK